MESIKAKRRRRAFYFPAKNGSAIALADQGLAIDADDELQKEAGEAEGQLFISRKRSYGDFVLVRALSAGSYSIIHYVEIEGQVQQLEVRYIHNAFELELLRRTQKLGSEGLYVDLEAASAVEYRRFEWVARRKLEAFLT